MVLALCSRSQTWEQFIRRKTIAKAIADLTFGEPAEVQSAVLEAFRRVDMEDVEDDAYRKARRTIVDEAVARLEAMGLDASTRAALLAQAATGDEAPEADGGEAVPVPERDQLAVMGLQRIQPVSAVGASVMAEMTSAADAEAQIRSASTERSVVTVELIGFAYRLPPVPAQPFPSILPHLDYDTALVRLDADLARLTTPGFPRRPNHSHGSRGRIPRPR